MRPLSLLMILLGGMVFGAGLALSTMVRPEVVLSFLRFQDAGLLLVLGSAVGISLLSYQLAPRLLRKPVLAGEFCARPELRLRETLLGAALFGVGWGLSGVCPGPAIAGLGMANWPMLVSLLGLFAGAWVQGWWASRGKSQ